MLSGDYNYCELSKAKQAKEKQNRTFFFFFSHMEKGEGSLSRHFEVILGRIHLISSSSIFIASPCICNN